MDIKNISYSTVLSHVFPGILLELQIFLAIGLFSPIDFLAKIIGFIQTNISNLISFGLLFFVLATILGFILDGIHHFIFRNRESQLYDIYEYINSGERLEIMKSLLDDDYWYPYEAYANIGIAMLPAMMLLPYWMLIRSFHWAFIVITMTIYLAVCAIMWYEAIQTLEIYKGVERALIKAFKSPEGDKRTQILETENKAFRN
jgi:fumarate reductase subunit D